MIAGAWILRTRMLDAARLRGVGPCCGRPTGWSARGAGMLIPMARVVAVALLAPCLSLLVASAAPAKTATPTPSVRPTVPGISLVAPAFLVVHADRAQWQDESSGEDGYRVIAKLGDETRLFSLPAGTQSITLPEDFRPSCDDPRGRSILRMRVFAFKGPVEGPSASGGTSNICAPLFTATPTAPVPVATPRSPALPATGTRPGRSVDRREVAAGSAALAFALFVVVAAGAARARDP